MIFNNVKFTIPASDKKSYQANEKTQKDHNSKGKKNFSIKTDLGITDMMKSADNGVKTVLVNMFHVLK